MCRISNILFLLIFTLLDFANALPLNCEDLLLVKPKTKQNKNVSIRENWSALVSRLRPTYQNKTFNLRILSTELRKNTFSPASLRKKAIQEVSEQQALYREMGFSFNSFIQVLVEAHPGAMGQIGLNEKGKFIWSESDEITAWVGSAISLIGISGFFGKFDLFTGKVDKKGFNRMPRFLVLPAVTSTYHSIQNLFVVSHELAHETENRNGHRDLIWREARADFLAYLATGLTNVVFPEGTELEFMHEDGSTYKKRVTLVRSISHPIVANLRNLWPSLGAYHHNSQILSSALYKIEQTLGRNRAIELVHWMDRIGEVDPIPYLEPKPTEPSPDFEPKPYTKYIDHQDINVIRSAISDHIEQFGQLFRKWSTETNLNPIEKADLLAILSENGI